MAVSALEELEDAVSIVKTLGSARIVGQAELLCNLGKLLAPQLLHVEVEPDCAATGSDYEQDK
jgi:hypothetical protein